jgi:hypothetical protein
MDLERREIPDGGLFARDGLITQVGPTAELPQTADEVLDLSGHVVLPGLINTHHHLYQTLTRAVPAAQNANLFDWLRVLYPIWARLTPRPYASRRRSGWPNWRCPAARLPPITCTSIPMGAGWTTRSKLQKKLDCAPRLTR